ncbi:MAG: TIGR00730 family Rossman fold protein [Candidatus Paceibacterota bacterium]
MSNKQPPSPEELSRRKIHEKAVGEHLDRIQREFHQGFEFLQKYKKTVSIFGSSMTPPEGERYQHAHDLAKKIAEETGYAIVDGGGPGIMEAASRGAQDGGGTSIGLRINLLRERTPNIYNTDSLDFNYFFTRKTMLAFAAEVYVFFPGGFGTFDELFSILTLIQTNKIPRVPIVLFGSSFWNPLKEFIVKNMLEANHTIDPQDLDLFEITDSTDRVIEIIRRAPVSEWWRNIN